ncbi:DNA gyrase inhibitor YacG [Rhodocyclus tenuis]|uniref:DNA gyrase inhibitor YacG n=1 Tax=Rhodocyclus tenuis TaxID=1066 RepID=UPI001292B26B|nr:DNA gyrase inhibitor YacG [Rhodocyclus tenuis]
MAEAVRRVRCPQCGGESLWSPDNRWRPFCSERCRLIDLGAWASEAYRVPVQASGLDDADSEFPPAPSADTKS